METKEEVTAGTPVKIAGVTIIPIIKIATGRWGRGRGLSVYGIERPVGVMVVLDTCTRGFDISGREVPLEHCIKNIPGLEAVLAKTR